MMGARLLKQTDAMLCSGQPPVRSIERVPGVIHDSRHRSPQWNGGRPAYEKGEESYGSLEKGS